MKKLFAILSVFLITGCINNYQLLKSGDTKLWGSYTVSTPENINQMKLDGLVSWSQYGPLLEQIRFIKPLSEGEKIPLIYPADNESKVPFYRSSMTPEEVVELYRSSVALGGSLVTAVSELDPIKLGSEQGYKFEVNMSSAQGKDYRAKVFFTTKDDKLYLIEFGAHATHYYESRQAFLQNVITSIKF